MKAVRINITIQDDLLEKVDAYTASNAMTRSGLIQLALSQYLQAQEMLPNLNNAFALMGSLAKRAATEGGVNTEEFNSELAALEQCQKQLAGKNPATSGC